MQVVNVGIFCQSECDYLSALCFTNDTLPHTEPQSRITDFQERQQRHDSELNAHPTGP